MKLSIVTINYNNAEGLRRTLASVAAQTYSDIEHIIVDGGSTDGSVDIIREYEDTIKQSVTIEQSTIQVKWLSEPDKGIYNAMNHGIEIALGRRVVNDNHTSNIKHHTSQESLCDYIQILNSGDLLAAPDVTERMVLRLNELTNERVNELDGVAILYGNMLKSYDGKIIINRDTCGGDMYTPESFLYFYKGTLNHDCAYIRRDLFEKYGLYNEDMRICSDIIKRERREYLEKILPATVLHDYDAFAFPILQYQRLKKHHLWPLVHFIERVLFKLEKWRILR